MNLRSTSLAPLRQPGFRLLYASSFLWYFGRWMDAIVSSWLALLLTNSPWHVALIGFYRNLPVMLFGPFTGAIADRIDRRTLLIASAIANAAAAATLAFLFYSGRMEFWHLAVANLVMGLAWSVEFPTRRAILPDLVGRERLLPAMVLDTVSMNVSRVCGPLLGGTVLALLDVTESYVVLALLYGGAAVPVLFLTLPAITRARGASAFRFLAEGLRFCGRTASVRGVLLITFLMNALAFPFMQLLSVFARDVLHVGPFELGLLTAGDGIGSLIGAAFLSASSFKRYGVVFAASSVGMCLALVAFSASPVFVLSLAMLILAGVGHAGFTTLQSTITLSVVGEDMRGRVMGVLTLAIGSATLGMLLSGAVASAFGAPWAVGLSGAVGALLVTATAATTPGLLAYEPREAAKTAIRAQSATP